MIVVGCTTTAGPDSRAISTSALEAWSTPTPEPEPTAVPEPTSTPEPEPTVTSAPTAIPEPTSTPEPEPTVTPAPTAVPDPTSTPEPAPEQAAAPTVTVTPAPVKQPLPPSGYTGDVLAIRTGSGLVLPVRAANPDGSYDIVTPCYNLASVSGGLPIRGPIDVLIDPGHGGEESGAVGPNGLKESTVNLQVAELLRAELIDRGYIVELTRYSDARVAIQSRTELANAMGPRVFMSIHHNGGYPEPLPVAGTEVFVQFDDPDGARLGGLVFEELEAAFADIEADWMGNEETRGVAWRMNDEGTDLYGILRRTPGLVTVLTEAMFISTPAEAELLAMPEILELEVDALAAALDRFFETDDPGSGFIDGIVFQGDLGNGGGTFGCTDPPL